MQKFWENSISRDDVSCKNISICNKNSFCSIRNSILFPFPIFITGKIHNFYFLITFPIETLEYWAPRHETTKNIDSVLFYGQFTIILTLITRLFIDGLHRHKHSHANFYYFLKKSCVWKVSNALLIPSMSIYELNFQFIHWMKILQTGCWKIMQLFHPILRHEKSIKNLFHPHDDLL